MVSTVFKKNGNSQSNSSYLKIGVFLYSTRSEPSPLLKYCSRASELLLAQVTVGCCRALSELSRICIWQAPLNRAPGSPGPSTHSGLWILTQVLERTWCQETFWPSTQRFFRLQMSYVNLGKKCTSSEIQFPDLQPNPWHC